LLLQRLHLHLDDVREVVAGGATLPDVPGVRPASLAGLPAPQPPDGAPAGSILAAAGLEFWVTQPRQYGLAEGVPGPLDQAAVEVADRLLDGVGVRAAEAQMLRSVTAAAAWWVGFFAIIRHRGVHHLTMAPVTNDVAVSVLESAARVVALGVATRLLEAWVRETAAQVEQARGSYCRALAEGIVIEREIPALLDALGELRLVDLTALSIPWRGRFTKYASGAGVGQVE